MERAARSTRARTGATMVLLLILLPVVLTIASYMINTVYMETTRTHLQISSDVATRAAGRVQAVTGDKDQAIAAADRLLKANPYMRQTLDISGTDIVFGASTRTDETERYAFNESKKINAVKLKAFGVDDVLMLFPTMGLPMTFRPIKTAISTQVELDISIVLDRSGSMAYASDEDTTNGNPPAANPSWTSKDPVPPNARWLATVDAVQVFLDIMSESSHDELVSLTTYSNKAKTDVPLTTEYSEITSAMNGHSWSFDGGATNIGGGILEGGKALSNKSKARAWASRVMIVMSDGIHNTGNDPIAASVASANENILIYTITFSDEANLAQMQRIAENGSGEHFHAENSDQLAQSFREIAKSLPTLITF